MEDHVPTMEERWSEACFREMAELWQLSEKEQSKMRVLQQRLQDVVHWTNDPFHVVRYFDEFKGNIPRV